MADNCYMQRTPHVVQNLAVFAICFPHSWQNFESGTGVPSSTAAVAFERGAVVVNAAAIPSPIMETNKLLLNHIDVFKLYQC